MPVTTYPSSVTLTEWAQPTASSSEELLKQACPKDHARCQRVIQSSFSEDLAATHAVSPSENGLVYAALHAYNHHHHLGIRPEDVWFTILSQLSFYVNTSPEELRSSFVPHEGKREVIVHGRGSMDTADFGALAIAMTEEMDKSLVDKDLMDWILLDFTTTTPGDTVTASVLMMGVMQSYFTHMLYMMCGLPSVTLLGEREDWVKIRQRLDRLGTWGSKVPEFAERLKTVLRYFIRTFDESDSPEVHDFWSKIVHYMPGGSGPMFLSGWLSAFCFWTPKGQRPKGSWYGCDIDGLSFLSVDTSDIPSGFVSVPVKVYDNGKEIKTEMVAGLVGISASSNRHFFDKTPALGSVRPDEDAGRQSEVDGKACLDSLQPVSGWWMYELKDKVAQKSECPGSAVTTSISLDM